MKVIFGLALVLGLLVIIPSIENALAAGDEPGEYLDRRVEIWGLFYRLMIVAFTVGTVVSGLIVWLVLRLAVRRLGKECRFLMSPYNET